MTVMERARARERARGFPFNREVSIRQADHLMEAIRRGQPDEFLTRATTMGLDLDQTRAFALRNAPGWLPEMAQA